jgi:DNA primase
VSRERKLKILNRVLGSPYIRGAEALYHCPSCDHHKKKLSINIDKNVFKCWVCDWSGKNVYRIVRSHGSLNDRYEWKSFQQEVEIENFSDKLFGQSEKTAEQEIDLPDQFVSLANKRLPATSLYPLNYLKSRGIDKKTIIKWKIGYCPSGPYGGRILIPSFNKNGDINYFVSRAYDRNWKKYMNPDISKDIIFNYPYLDFDEDMVIVEGVFDAMKAGDNSVPLLGSTLNENSKLFSKIVKNDTPVYLALDPDAHKKTNKLVSLFLKYDAGNRASFRRFHKRNRTAGRTVWRRRSRRGISSSFAWI